MSPELQTFRIHTQGQTFILVDLLDDDGRQRRASELERRLTGLGARTLTTTSFLLRPKLDITPQRIQEEIGDVLIPKDHVMVLVPRGEGCDCVAFGYPPECNLRVEGDSSPSA